MNDDNDVNDVPFSEEKFWALIEKAFAPDFETQTAKLAELFGQLSVTELRWFDYYFMLKLNALHTWSILQYQSIVFGGGDDSFTDLKDWLVFRGRDGYETALRDPDSLSSDMRKYRGQLEEGGRSPVLWEAIEARGDEEVVTSPPAPPDRGDMKGEPVPDELLPVVFPIAWKEFVEKQEPHPG